MTFLSNSMTILAWYFPHTEPPVLLEPRLALTSLCSFARIELPHLLFIASIISFVIALVLCSAILVIFNRSLSDLRTSMRTIFASMSLGAKRTQGERERNLWKQILRPDTAVKEIVRTAESIAAEVREWKLQTSAREKAHLEWLAFLSHDLASPLARTLGRLQCLEDVILDEAKSRELLEASQTEIIQITESINSISQMAILESGIDRKSSNVDLNLLLENSVEAFAFEAREKGIALTFNALIDNVVLVAERTLLRRAVENLISNAIRHTPHDGSIIVSLRGSEGGVQISVCDTGTGVPADLIPKLFDFGFSSETSERPARFGSMGLGLAMVRMVATVHGGTVSAKNRQPSGAEFVISLPNQQPGTPEKTSSGGNG